MTFKKILLITLPFWGIIFILTPPFQCPDEPQHYSYVQSLANMNLPVLPINRLKNSAPESEELATLLKDYRLSEIAFNQDRIVNFNQPKEIKESDFTRTTTQAYHPPVYYLLGAALYKIASFVGLFGIERYQLTRLASFLFYLMTLFFLFKILQLFFEKSAAGYFTLAVSLQPTLLMISTNINPEIASVSFATATFYLCLLLIKKRQLELKPVLLLAVFSALTFLSKFTGILLIPIALISILLVAKLRGDLKKGFLWSTLFLFLLGLIVLPWLIRNFFLYHQVIVDNLNLMYQPSHQILSKKAIISQLFHDYYSALLHIPGFFGWLDAPLFLPLRILYVWVISILLALGFFHLVKNREKQLQKFSLILSFIFIGLLLIFNLIYSLKVHLEYGRAALQGRYFLIVLAPITIVLFYAIKRLLKLDDRKLAKWSLIFSIWFYLLIIFFVLLPRYYV